MAALHPIDTSRPPPPLIGRAAARVCTLHCGNRIGPAAVRDGVQCGNEPTSGNVTLATSSIVVGATAAATATLRDAQGNVLAGRVVAWSSANAAIASVSQAGVVTGIAAGGPVTITATSEGPSGSTQVTVTPVPVIDGMVYFRSDTIAYPATSSPGDSPR